MTVSVCRSLSVGRSVRRLWGAWREMGVAGNNTDTEVRPGGRVEGADRVTDGLATCLAIGEPVLFLRRHNSKRRATHAALLQVSSARLTSGAARNAGYCAEHLDGRSVRPSVGRSVGRSMAPVPRDDDALTHHAREAERFVYDDCSSQWSNRPTD